jgi:hypothetical protein
LLQLQTTNPSLAKGIFSDNIDQSDRESYKLFAIDNLHACQHCHISKNAHAGLAKKSFIGSNFMFGSSILL